MSSPTTYFQPTTPPARRERPKSSFSFRSDKSNDSFQSKPKVDLTEKTKDKRRLNIFSKANPNSAITELEPGTAANLGGSTMCDLRQIVHKDNEGNVIADPDRSNPTRPRLERPLDTIRSFEAAIDSSYRRNESPRTEAGSTFGGFSSRRSSSYNALDNLQSSRHSQVGGYYEHRPRNHRYDHYDNNAGPSSYVYGRKPFGPRVHSEPMIYHRSHYAPPAPPVHNSNQYYEAYDTDHTASNGSASTEPWGNSTDPSSENSSLDRIQGYNKPETADPYGRSSPIRQPVMEEAGVSGRTYPQPTFRPPPPMSQPRSAFPQTQTYSQGQNSPGQSRYDERLHMTSALPQSSYLTKSPPANRPAPNMSSAGQTYNRNGPSYRPATGPPVPPKRKSWLKRTFSKKQ